MDILKYGLYKCFIRILSLKKKHILSYQIYVISNLSIFLNELDF